MSAHKWWRVINITVRTGAFSVRSAAELRFINSEGIDSNVPSKAFSESIFGAGYEAGNAFDNNAATMAHSETFGTNNQQGYLYYIGYQFDTPVTVTSIAVQMRQDMTPDFGQEWQTAVIQCSDNGIDWAYYGYIDPKISHMNISLITAPIHSADTISISLSNKSSALNIYSNDESGSLSGLVTQGESGELRLPLKAEVLLYDRMTNNLLQRTWSDNSGAYSFNGLDAGREYYAVTVHPDRTYNAVVQDGLKSGMTA